MPAFKAKFVLTDIEGTTTSIDFVKKVLFPYSKLHLRAYMESNLLQPFLGSIVDELLDLDEFGEFHAAHMPELEEPSLDDVTAYLIYLIDRDLKLTPLKQLQGFIWEDGYKKGELTSHIFDDVRPAFEQWRASGLRIAIYSSGSVHAQKLLFSHTEQGDLMPLIQACFDTNVGSKQDQLSYVNIAKQLEVNPQDVLFLTDVVKEAEAARLAGMQTAILNRPGNAPLTDDDKLAYEIVDSFSDLSVTVE